MAKYLYREDFASGVIVVCDVADLSGKALDIARADINEAYNHEDDDYWTQEWWDFDAFKLSSEDLTAFCDANELLFRLSGTMVHIDDVDHLAELEQETLAGELIAEATVRFGRTDLYDSAQWIARMLMFFFGISLPRHSGLIVLEDGSTLHCSREHGGLFFSLPATLEPTE